MKPVGPKIDLSGLPTAKTSTANYKMVCEILEEPAKFRSPQLNVLTDETIQRTVPSSPTISKSRLTHLKDLLDKKIKKNVRVPEVPMPKSDQASRKGPGPGTPEFENQMQTLLEMDGFPVCDGLPVSNTATESSTEIGVTSSREHNQLIKDKLSEIEKPLAERSAANAKRFFGLPSAVIQNKNYSESKTVPQEIEDISSSIHDLLTKLWEIHSTATTEYQKRDYNHLMSFVASIGFKGVLTTYKYLPLEYRKKFIAQAKAMAINPERITDSAIKQLENFAKMLNNERDLKKSASEQEN